MLRRFSDNLLSLLKFWAQIVQDKRKLITYDVIQPVCII